VKPILPIAHFAVLSLLFAMLAGCSMGIALSIPKDVSYVLKPGSKRSDVIAILGQPRKSTALSPPRPAPSLPEAWPSAKVTLCDEYKVSGLLLTPDEAGAYDNQWSIYPICLMLTAGASEAIMLPATAGDLTLRSLRRYRLRLWYDRSQKLVTYDKH
jgi:hypothetical protein